MEIQAQLYHYFRCNGDHISKQYLSECSKSELKALGLGDEVVVCEGKAGVCAKAMSSYISAGGSVAPATVKCKDEKKAAAWAKFPLTIILYFKFIIIKDVFKTCF